MSDTKSLDAKIRDNARLELEKKLDALFEPIQREVTAKSLSFKQTRFAVNVGDGKYNVQDVHCVLQKLRADLYQLMRAEHEENAIAEFVRKVDSLQEQIDDLREQVPEE